MNNNDITFYFDESGYKGYLKNTPSKNDFCLVGGFGIPNKNRTIFENKLSDIFKNLDTTDVKKIHATEIFKNGKNSEIKKNFIECILNEFELLIIYEAINCYGVYQHNQFVENLAIEAENIRRNKHIQISKSQKQENIYFNSLEGLLIKIDEMCNIENTKKLIMISDNMDKKLLKECIYKLNYLKEEIHIHKTTGYNSSTKKLVTGLIKFEVTNFDTKVKYIKDISIEEDFSYLTLAADIIINLIYRHLMDKISNNSNNGLNSERIMEDFILKSKIAFLDDNHILDKLYKNS